LVLLQENNWPRRVPRANEKEALRSGTKAKIKLRHDCVSLIFFLCICIGIYFVLFYSFDDDYDNKNGY